MSSIGERQPTPIDDRGLINHNELVRIALRHANEHDPSLISTQNDTHHVYWFLRRVVRPEHDPSVVNRFVELPVNKIWMPRGLHNNTIHQITHPPELPPTEVMQYRIDAWDVAWRLFRNEQLLDEKIDMTAKWSDLRTTGRLGNNTDDSVGWEWLQSEYNARAHEFELLQEQAEGIPEDFRLDRDFGRNVAQVISLIAAEGRRAHTHRTGRLTLSVLGFNIEPVAA